MAPVEWVLRERGLELERERKARGLTRVQLVALMQKEPECEGVVEQTIYKWERGKGRPNLPQSLALERIFKKPVRKWYEAVEAGA